MASDDGTTIGVWIGAHDSTLEEFDETMNCGPDRPGSRSDETREAMRMQTSIQQTFDSLDIDLHGPEARGYIRQLIYDDVRREETADE